MDRHPAVVVNSIEAKYGLAQFYTHRHTMRGYSFLWAVNKTEHLITVLRPGVAEACLLAHHNLSGGREVKAVTARRVDMR